MIPLNLWFFPIAAAAVHGLFLAVVFFRKKGNRAANRWFAGLLLAVSLHLAEYALSVSGLIFRLPHLMLSTYPLLFIIAPLYYLYVQAYLNQAYQRTGKLLLHFLPAFLVFLFLLPFYRQSGEAKIFFFRTLAGNAFQSIPDEQFVIMILQIGQLLVYLYLAYRLIRNKEAAWTLFRQNGNEQKIRWLIRSTLALGGFTVFYGVMTVLLTLRNTYRVETDYVVVLLLALLLFIIGYVAMLQPDLFDEALKNGRKQSLLTPGSARSVKEKLMEYMRSEKPYLREDLKITDLSDYLSIPAHHLSEVLNHELHTNFFDFVNGYRIETAKALLADPQRREEKILSIAFDSGFGNKATFNRVFKRATGMTPSEFKKSYLRK